MFTEALCVIEKNINKSLKIQSTGATTSMDKSLKQDAE